MNAQRYLAEILAEVFNEGLATEDVPFAAEGPADRIVDADEVLVALQRVGLSVKRFNRLYGRDDIEKLPTDWDEHVVVLWEEDECLRNDPDSEKIYPTPGSGPPMLPKEGAWKRITGMDYTDCTSNVELAKLDCGDAVYYLHSGGWVEISSYNGSAVGVLTRIVPRES